MKILLVLLILISNIKIEEFYCKAYIVMDGNSGIILEEKNKDYIQSVASISKIMTAIIAIENSNLSNLYTIGEEVNKAWGSSVYLHIGDRITLKDLLYGAMLRSGNDACNVIAVNIAGSIDRFVDMMNDKAKEIGMNNTVFSNPTGLDEEDNGNMSSVYDMALLMKYCTQNPIFNEIINTKIYIREDGNGRWKNKNRLLDEYEYCVGGKTGYTKKAKRTLVTRAIKDDYSLIIVTFNCGNDFEFHKNKYIECFNNIDKYMILSKGIYNYKGHSFVLDKDIFFYKDSKVSYIIKDNYIDIIVDNKKIKSIQYNNKINCIIKYINILIGDLFG